MGNTIGLKRNTVKILQHQDVWHSNFEKEKKLLLSIKNKHIKGIEHTGSTSIPNMPAKPIIDIIFGIDNFYNAPKLIKNLSEIGYEFRREPRRFQWLFVKMSGGKDTHYLKIIRHKGNYWNEYINFKKILMHNKEAFKKYKNLKLDLEKKYSNNRKEYTKNKNNLIQKLLLLV
ncbi:MAG: GrpB family protein [Candidatus Uhrbacteria bacterium]|nr:GrpB family protein [Candidatus Uhrbacteria bacterium]